MINQPNDIVNLGVGFDYKNYSIRVSMLYKNDVFSSFSFYNETTRITDDYLRWDLSMSYKFPKIKGVKIFMNIANITAAQDIVLIKGNEYQASVQHYGRTVDFGAKWNL